MGVWEWVRAVGILAPITIMIVVGFAVALRSGATYATATGAAKTASGTLPRTLLTISAYLVGLAILHTLVGQQLPSMR